MMGKTPSTSSKKSKASPRVKQIVKFKAPQPISPAVVRHLRRSTQDKSKALKIILQKRSTAPTRHPNAQSRAIDDLKSTLTSSINQNRVNALKIGNAYKDNTVRVKFKGTRELATTTTGTALDGAHIGRGTWTPTQKKVSQYLSQQLMGQHGFTPASNTSSKWGAEIAHGRAQHAGGLTDLLGAQPASVHSNIEDMAREEGQKILAKKLGNNVRIKSTIYVHKTGDLAGTVKASRHKIYIKSDAGKWEKKLDHLQDGARGDINKSEAKELKDRVAGLNKMSPTLVSKRGIGDLAPLPVGIHTRPKGNDTTQSPHFTDMTVFKKKTNVRQNRSGKDAHDKMSSILEKRAAKLP